MNNRYLLPFLFLVCAGITSCKFLSMEALEITAHKPSSHVVSIPELEAVSISFSAEVSRENVETAFTLEEDGIEVPGKFEWAGKKKVQYRPFKPFNETSRYLITVSTAAEDMDGNSLDKEFHWEFRGTPDTTRPTLIQVSPIDRSRIATVRPEITLSFSEPMNPSSVFDGISFQPLITGYFVESQDLQTFRYKVTEDLAWQTWYTITVNDSVRDSAGNTQGSDYSYSFFTGTKSGELHILTVTAAGTDILRENTETPEEEITEGIEKDSSITILFSEPVDRDTVSGSISLSPSIASDFAWNETGNELTITYIKPFTYGTTYTLSLSSTITDIQGNELLEDVVHKFRANGSASQPPEVSAAYITNEFSSQTPVTRLLLLEPLDLIPLPQDVCNDQCTGFLDIYIDVAEGASISPFTFIDAFSVSTENASITPVACQTGSDITYMTATFPPQIVEGTIPVRIIIQIDNSGGDYDDVPGKMTLSLDSSFCDSLENYLSETWTLDVYTTN